MDNYATVPFVITEGSAISLTKAKSTTSRMVLQPSDYTMLWTVPKTQMLGYYLGQMGNPLRILRNPKPMKRILGNTIKQSRTSKTTLTKT